MKKAQKIISVGLIVIFAACKKPYSPPAITSPGSYLVVEGVINNGTDSTIIKLSRTVNLSSNSVNNPVTGATVLVQSNQNTSYPLIENKPGTYSCPGLNLNNSYQYRLSISTGSEQYQSDYVPVLNSPPIDSVGYAIASNGLNIYSNTHDPTNMINYYRWDYQETWVYHPDLASGYVSNGDTVLARTPAQQEYYCWPSDTSSTIILNSSARLSKAVIIDNPITFVASTSQKLGDISAGSVASKRIFIHNQQLPAWLPTPLYLCKVDTFYYGAVIGNQVVNQVNEFLNYDKGTGDDSYIPINALSNPLGIIIAYTASSPECTECNLFGPNVEPSFWQ